MCTVITGFDPSAPVPLVLAAVRDELLLRPWEPPARHWPDRPGLVGGRDTEAGGTWLAVRTGPGARVCAVLNAAPRGGSEGEPPVPTVPPGARLSRGRLPLLGADGGTDAAEGEDLERYEPFHLVVADPSGGAVLTWDGREERREALPAGVSVVTNSGLDAGAPRAVRHTPVFGAARPGPGAGELEAARTPEEVWGEWPRLLDEGVRGPARTGGYGTGEDDPASLAAHVELGPDRVWATSSMALAAVAPEGARMAFSAEPGTPEAWRMVGEVR
ncbi:NRDE family protein [Nocardiopsis suaedae]|uniref:NRDE family protein n=1 Tax=Nocardiopsis suaedae TaxID=3018444 RepID=A0ABT4TJM8_9ACTN|nr:NRDE family protein [Nocardiopsis suaedae]MDA2804881.1 NRDE family protein [Nocardiopsis suaedae]